MVAGDHEDPLRGAQRAQTLADLIELNGQAEVGEVSGYRHRIRRLGRH